MSTPGTAAIARPLDRRRGLQHHRHDRLLVEGVEQVPLGHRLVAVGGVGAGDRPVPAGREAAGVDDLLGLGPGLDVRHDHAHRADVERTREVLVVGRGHPHERRDPGRDRTRAQHRRRLPSEMALCSRST
jgi:hypothetical protein